MALGPHGEPLPESSVRRSKSFELEPAAGRQESAGPKLKLLRTKSTDSEVHASPLARSDSSSVLSRRASQAEAGLTGKHRRASQAQIHATHSSGDGIIEKIQAALDESYTDVEGMRELLALATRAELGENISVQILEAKVQEAEDRLVAGSSSAELEDTLPDRIDEALGPGFGDAAAMRRLLDEAEATNFHHPMVTVLRTKCQDLEFKAASPSAGGLGPVAGREGSEEEETEEEEEEGEDGDTFAVDGDLPAFKPAPPTPKMQSPATRRGSVVQFGGRRMSLSVGAELGATAERLRRANESGDAIQMQAALDAAAPAALMEGPGQAEVQKLAMEIAERLNTDEKLKTSMSMKRSARVREKVQRLWDLMVVESANYALQTGAPRPGSEGDDGEVTKEGYKLLHMRIAKVLTDAALYDEREAEQDALDEWDADVARFLGSSHIMVWLDTIRTKFHENTATAVVAHGFDALFKQYDEDGSGELDMEEFSHAVRNDLGVSKEMLKDHELRKMFYAVDTDGGGSVDSKEFVEWLMAPGHAGHRMTEVKEQFKEAASKQTTTLGWKFIFDKYDDDGSGELDIDEFRQCVRHECKLTQEECSDDDVVELFCIVDADESGAIDATELRTFLTTDLEAASMTFAPFMASVFELTALWVPTESEGQYARFLQVVFNEISEPVGDGQSAAELSQLPVYNEERDADGNLVPNFRLRPLDQVGSLIGSDGTLEGFDAKSLEAQRLAEEQKRLAAERRKKWREEQAARRAAEERKKRREEEKAAAEAARQAATLSTDGLELVLGLRWHDGSRWHEKPAPEKRKRKKRRAAEASAEEPGGADGPTTELQYSPASRMVRRKPRKVLPELKETKALKKPVILMKQQRNSQPPANHRPMRKTKLAMVSKHSEELTKAAGGRQPQPPPPHGGKHRVSPPAAPAPVWGHSSKGLMVKHGDATQPPPPPSPDAALAGWGTDGQAEDSAGVAPVPLPEPELRPVAPPVQTPSSTAQHTPRSAHRSHRRHQPTANLDGMTAALQRRPASSRSRGPGIKGAELAGLKSRAWSPRVAVGGGGAGFRGFFATHHQPAIVVPSAAIRMSAVAAVARGHDPLAPRAASARARMHATPRADAGYAARPATAGQLISSR